MWKLWCLCVIAIGAAACGGGDDDAGPAGPTFPAVDDFAAVGPFEVGRPVFAEACTLVYPTRLGEGGLKHPVIVWGNGTSAMPSYYGAVLDHWATHGFIVAAANTSNAGSGVEMLACLDYVLAQNTTTGSAFEGKVDVAHIGVSGHSQGGAGAMMVGRDERITVTAPLEPFIQIALGGFESASITEQFAPMFMMSGSADTIAAPPQNQQPIFDTTNVPVVWGTLIGADHLGSALGDITGFRGPATAWFRLHLMGDETARSMFYGDSCTLCTDPAWEVQRNGIE